MSKSIKDVDLKVNLTIFINCELLKIAKKLPNAVDENPASFQCGVLTGRKHALLDLQELLDVEDE